MSRWGARQIAFIPLVRLAKVTQNACGLGTGGRLDYDWVGGYVWCNQSVRLLATLPHPARVPTVHIRTMRGIPLPQRPGTRSISV